MRTRTFFIINEFWGRGPEHLGSLLCVSHEVLVWAPIPGVLDAACKDGRSLIDSETFMGLVKREHSPIKVMARQPWLTDAKARRRAAIPEARKFTRFDHELAEMTAKGLSAETLDEQSVFSAPPPTGYNRAQRMIDDDTSGRLRAGLLSLYANGECPPNVAGRAEHYEEADGKPLEQTILGDILNQEEAIRQSACHASFMDPEYLSFVRRVAALDVQFAIPAPDPTLHDRVVPITGAHGVLHRMEGVVDRPSLLAFVGSPEHTAFADYLQRSDVVDVRKDLLMELANAAPGLPLLWPILKDVVSRRDDSAGQLLKSDVALLLGTLCVGRAVGSLLVRALYNQAAQHVVQKAREKRYLSGKSPTDAFREHAGLTGLFVLCFGHKYPTLDEVERLKRQLMGILDEDESD